jgi:hypothetical protein
LPVPFFQEWMRQMELRQVLQSEPRREEWKVCATADVTMHRCVDRYDR